MTLEFGGCVCTVMAVLCLMDPLTPVTVAEYVPTAVEVGTVTVNVDVPLGVIDVGLRVVVSPPSISSHRTCRVPAQAPDSPPPNSYGTSRRFPSPRL